MTNTGFEPLPKMKGIDGPELEKQLREPDHERVFAVAAAFKKGWSVDRVHDLTKIDRWYLHKLKHINDMLVALEETKVRRVVCCCCCCCCCCFCCS